MGVLWWRTTTEDIKHAPSPPTSPVEHSLVVYEAVAPQIGAIDHTLQGSAEKETEWCGFVETYGRFAGPSLVCGLLLALAWTLFLLILNIAPTWTINHLFGTQEVDDGDFWLLSSQSHAASLGLVVACLAAIALYYLYLLFLLAWKRKDAAIVDDFVDASPPSCATCLCEIAKKHFGALDDEARPYLKVSEEVPEIAYQTVLLHVLMESGVPSALVLFFATMVATNCFVRCYRLVARTTYHERNDSLANALFQFFFAVLFPMVLLFRAASAFQFDRDLYALRIEHFEVGSFERLARFAQPEAYTSTHVIARTLIEMLILSNKAALSVSILGIHLALLWRWHDILLGSLLGYKKRRLPTTGSVVGDDSCLNLLRIVKAVYWYSIKLLLAVMCVSKTLIPKAFALLLFAYGTGIVVVTSIGIAYSSQSCEASARCVLHAHEFNGFSASRYAVCPCVVYVNQPTGTVTSWSQWTIRRDATSDLRVIAASGRLEVVQIVDRDVAHLPDVIGKCEKLRVLVLVRTGLKDLPPWLADMEGLQILHIAGDEASVLGSFPLETEVFERMDNLRELRLENLRKLRSLPPFPEEVLAGLRLMVLRDLPFVHSIPVIGHLGNLRVLVITDLPRLERLPLLPGKLRTLRVEMPTALCCNGYLDDGTKVCGPKTDSILASQCRLLDIASNSSELCLSSDTLNSTQTIHTQQWLAAVGFQCSNSNIGDTDYASTLNSITRASVEACDGAMYRECSLPILDINTSSGMCLGASRLQVVHCVPKDPRYQAMRRAEIHQRPGGCNRAFERWLGC